MRWRGNSSISWREVRPSCERCTATHSYTYTVRMGNITLSVDDELLRAVRRYCAGRNTRVDAIVRDYLTRLAGYDDRAQLARARLRRLSRQSQGRLGRLTWTRADLYER